MRLTNMLAVAVFAVAGGRIDALGAQGGREQRLPDTPTGRIVTAYLSAFNSGDEKNMRAFFTANVAPARLQMRSVEERVQIFRGMFGNTGGLELRELLGTGDSAITGLFETKKQEWRKITFNLDPGPPPTLISLGVEDADRPKAPARPAESEPAGSMSQAEMISAVGEYLDGVVKADKFSGTVLLAKDGVPIFEHAYGLAQVERGAPNRIDTKFNLGSDNKLFTQVAIGQMIEQGKVSFGDTIGKFLPDYPNRDAARKVTVRQLLAMKSGIGDFFGPKFDATPKEKIRTTKDYLALFADQPLEFEPGTKQQYSNGGYIVLGAIVEKASGQDYYDYVREHIYKPAGMENSDSYDRDARVPNMATGYTRDDGKGDGPRRLNYDGLPGRGSSAGGGYSTAPDLLRFAAAIHSGKLLSPKYTTWFVTREEPKDGTSPDPAKPRAFGWLGGSPGVNAAFMSNATTGYTLIVLSNYDPPSAEEVSAHLREMLKRVTK